MLEAGPCPVTAIRTVERDGYEAVQLAFGACKEKVLTRAELGHLKKADASAHRHLVEFRDEAGELLVGETVTVEAFEVGAEGQDLRQVQGQGLPGHDQAPQLRLAAPSPTARTTCARRARSAPRPTPSRVMKGIRGPGRMGGGRDHPARADVVEIMPEPQPAARARRRPRPDAARTVEVRTDG